MKFKIDTYILEAYKISDAISKGRKLYHIYLQYNGLKSQTDFIVDLEDASNIDRLFTDRQKSLFIKKLKTLSERN